MTLENDFNTLISEMESNLQSMGVSDAEFDPSTGLRGLTARILDIEPSIGGLDLDTAVSITASESTIIIGQSVVLTSKLTASYDDDTIVDVDLTGVLTGATIHFKEGNTVIGTGITDNSGVATATISNLPVGTHTIKAVFEGTENFNDCQSTAITITVNKITPTITLSVPATGTVGTIYTVSGTLANPNTGTVKIYRNNSLVTSVTATGGSFSYSLRPSAAGTFTYYAVYEGDSTHEAVTSSTGSIIVRDSSAPASITLTADKSILSYADSESATLSATVLDSSSQPCEGETVEFFKDSVSMGTAVTNSSGIATKTYVSAGAGDVGFTAECGSFVTESFAIRDALKHITNFSTGWVNDGTIKYYTGYTCPNQCKVSFAFDSGFNKVRCGIGEDTGQYVTVCYVDFTYTFMYNTPSQTLHTLPISLTSSDVLSVELDNATATWFKNDNQVDTASIPTNYTKQIRFVLANNFTPRYVTVMPL